MIHGRHDQEISLVHKPPQQGHDLYPGDIICGGTCSGTELDTSPLVDGVTEPDRFLQPGDILEAWVEKIGTLRNPVL